jgi:hypothetical protein
MHAASELRTCKECAGLMTPEAKARLNSRVENRKLRCTPQTTPRAHKAAKQGAPASPCPLILLGPSTLQPQCQQTSKPRVQRARAYWTHQSAP